MEAEMDQFAALKGTLKNGPDAVLKAYQLSDDVGQLQYKVYRYSQLQRDVDLRNNDINAKLQQVQSMFAQFGTATSWFTPELLTIPQEKMEQWIAATPALAPYRFTILDNYRQQKHVLDEKGETASLLRIAIQSGTPRNAFQELSTSDIKFPKVTLVGRKRTHPQSWKLSTDSIDQPFSSRPSQSFRGLLPNLQ